MSSIEIVTKHDSYGDDHNDDQNDNDDHDDHDDDDDVIEDEDDDVIEDDDDLHDSGPASYSDLFRPRLSCTLWPGW